jgi:hypothetical protein
MMRQSGGAIQNRAQAVLVLVVSGGFTLSALYLGVYGTNRNTPVHFAHITPPAPKPFLSENASGEARDTHSYKFNRVRAGNVKRALDHVLPTSSVTSQLQGKDLMLVSVNTKEVSLIQSILANVDRADVASTDDNKEYQGIVDAMIISKAKWIAANGTAASATGTGKTVAQILYGKMTGIDAIPTMTKAGAPSLSTATLSRVTLSDDERPGLLLRNQASDDALVEYEGHVVDKAGGVELYKTFAGNKVIRKVAPSTKKAVSNEDHP